MKSLKTRECHLQIAMNTDNERDIRMSATILKFPLPSPQIHNVPHSPAEEHQSLVDSHPKSNYCGLGLYRDLAFRLPISLTS